MIENFDIFNTSEPLCCWITVRKF